MDDAPWWKIIWNGTFKFYWWPGVDVGIYKVYYNEWMLTFNFGLFSLEWSW